MLAPRPLAPRDGCDWYLGRAGVARGRARDADDRRPGEMGFRKGIVPLFLSSRLDDGVMRIKEAAG